MSPSYIQIYTGNGKGKTTAVLGLTIRALGAGKSVFIGQFLKNREYSEIKMLSRIEDILDSEQLLHVEQFGIDRCIGQNPRPEDVKAAQQGWDRILAATRSGEYDIVIMDEINIAIHLKLIDKKAVTDLMEKKPESVELILTGRYADKEIMKKADLVSEVQDVKHYYSKGIKARAGIEC